MPSLQTNSPAAPESPGSWNSDFFRPSGIRPSDFSHRLVPLCDGRPGLRGALHVLATQAPDSSQATLDFVASDATLDRYDEVIVPTGWRLQNYLRNPVFQNCHQYGDILHTLGKALITEVRTIDSRPVLLQRIQFATDANPIAKIAHALYAGGFLNTVSVGFVPIRWTDSDSPGSPRRTYIEQELLEVSAVPIPANPNALALALKSGALQKSDLRETLDLLRCACAEPSTLGPLSAGVSTKEGQPSTLALARHLRDLLRHC